jgi:hypothetical protein
LGHTVSRIANRTGWLLLPLAEVHLRAFALRLAGQLLDPGLEAVLWAEPGHGDGCLACSYHGLAYGPAHRRCTLAVASLAMTRLGVAVVCRVPTVGSRCKSWSPIRPVLKHGPRSLAYTRAIGCKTHRHNESEGPAAGLTCELTGFGPAMQHGPVPVACDGAETERMR